MEYYFEGTARVPPSWVTADQLEKAITEALHFLGLPNETSPVNPVKVGVRVHHPGKR